VGFFKNWYSGQFVYFICKKHTQKTGTLSRVPGGDGVRLLRHTSLPGYDTDVTQHYTDPHSDPILWQNGSTNCFHQGLNHLTWVPNLPPTLLYLVRPNYLTSRIPIWAESINYLTSASSPFSRQVQLPDRAGPHPSEHTPTLFSTNQLLLTALQPQTYVLTLVKPSPRVRNVSLTLRRYGSSLRLDTLTKPSTHVGNASAWYRPFCRCLHLNEKQEAKGIYLRRLQRPKLTACLLTHFSLPAAFAVQCYPSTRHFHRTGPTQPLIEPNPPHQPDSGYQDNSNTPAPSAHTGTTERIPTWNEIF